jgi:hypothetical protein
MRVTYSEGEAGAALQALPRPGGCFGFVYLCRTVLLASAMLGSHLIARAEWHAAGKVQSGVVALQQFFP